MAASCGSHGRRLIPAVVIPPPGASGRHRFAMTRPGHTVVGGVCHAQMLIGALAGSTPGIATVFKKSRIGFVALLVWLVGVVAMPVGRAYAAGEIGASVEGKSCVSGTDEATVDATPITANSPTTFKYKCFVNSTSTGANSVLTTIAAGASSGSGANPTVYTRAPSTSWAGASCGGSGAWTLTHGQLRSHVGAAIGSPKDASLPDNYVEFTLTCTWSIGTLSGYTYAAPELLFGPIDFVNDVDFQNCRQAATGSTSQACSPVGTAPANGSLVPILANVSGSGASVWASTVPDHFLTGGGFTSPACESVEVEVEYKAAGSSTWVALANPAGTTILTGGQVNLLFERPDATPTLELAYRFQRGAPYRKLGDLTGATGSWIVTKLAGDGGPSDLGAFELVCRDDEDALSYRTLSATDDWGDDVISDRPCLNMSWHWPPNDELLADGTTTYPVTFSISPLNGGAAELTGLYVDHDDDALTAPEGVLSHFVAGDSDSWDMRVGQLFLVGDPPGAEVHNLITDGGYNPDDGTATTLLFGILLEDGPADVDSYDASKFGVWCTDDVGDPVLYRFDSTYEPTRQYDPFGDPERSAGSCYGDALGSMSLTSPKSWVSGIGRMATCLVEFLFVPDGDVIGEEFEELQANLEEQFPFSMLFLAVDFAEKLGDELESASGTGCFDMPGSFSFGSFSTSVSDVCIGDDMTVSAGQRELLAAIVIAPLLWALCAHAVRLVSGGKS